MRNPYQQASAQVVPFPAREPEGSLTGLFSEATTESFAAGQSLFWEGDAAAGIFLIGQGMLRLYRSLSDGRRVITGFATKGDIIGLAFRSRYLCTAEALADVRVRRISRRRLGEAIDAQPGLRPQLLDAISDELSRAQDQILLLGRQTAEERVASFLLTMAEQAGPGQVLINLPMTRLDMADYLGLTIETVCRVLSRMQRDGLIAFRGRYDLSICRPRALCEMAGRQDWLEAPAARARVN
ncbi:MAG TPA: helix-turn-helix domain-containing protein [Paracoccaceae bacterium]|nr:helix-turn-helix domain-containing protein [Paracoccaceae bacterium]